jgi:hypothetical protein
MEGVFLLFPYDLCTGTLHKIANAVNIAVDTPPIYF